MDLFGFEEPPKRGKVVVVTGGRFFTDRNFIEDRLEWFHDKHHISALFHGGANGVDNISGSWAWDNGIPMFECRANWSRYPRAAGPIRNHWMKQFSGASHLLAFPGKRGTAHMSAACEQHGMTIIKFELLKVE